MATSYRIIDFRGPGGGFDPSKFVTKEELFDASTGKIKPEYIDASISAEIDLTKISTDASNTPLGVTWKKTETSTVTGTLPASYSTRSYIYLVKDYDKTSYSAYITTESSGSYAWTKLESGTFDLDYVVIEE